MRTNLSSIAAGVNLFFVSVSSLMMGVLRHVFNNM